MIESEKLLEKKLKRVVARMGGWSLKLPAIFVNGLPDQMCLLPGGRIFFAEVKTTGEKPSKIQLAIHRKLRKLGFEVYVVDCSGDITDIRNVLGD